MRFYNGRRLGYVHLYAAAKPICSETWTDCSMYAIQIVDCGTRYSALLKQSATIMSDKKSSGSLCLLQVLYFVHDHVFVLS